MFLYKQYGVWEGFFLSKKDRTVTPKKWSNGHPNGEMERKCPIIYSIIKVIVHFINLAINRYIIGLMYIYELLTLQAPQGLND